MRVNEQGRSMIEMLGVLAIVGVLSVGGIAGYSKAMNKFKTNKVSDQVQMISTNIRTLFSSQRTYAGLNNGTAVKAGLVPGEMYDTASGSKASGSTFKITNSFGGGVYIGAAASATNNDDMAFVISFSGIPQSSCVSIATTDWGGDVGSGLAAMNIAADAGADNNAKAKAGYTALKDVITSSSTNLHVPGDDNYGLPYSIMTANNSCSGDENTIAWKYI